MTVGQSGDSLEPAPHHAVCGECGQPWPCPGERHQRRVRRLNFELERICPVCVKVVEAGHMYALIDGRYYHLAKRHRRCRAVALELDPRLKARQ
jgi:hypothetical protein